MIDDNQYSFLDSVKYCNDLGGTLPIIHSQEDYDYLMEKLKETKTGYDRTWLGLKKVGDDCKTWMDGSKLTFKFTYDPINGGDSCCPTKDCALKLWNNVESTTQYGKVFMSEYKISLGGRRVCVLKNLFLKELDEKAEKIEESLTKKLEEKSLQQSKSLNEMRATMLQQYQNLEEGVKKNITSIEMEHNEKITQVIDRQIDAEKKISQLREDSRVVKKIIADHVIMIEKSVNDKIDKLQMKTQESLKEMNDSMKILEANVEYEITNSRQDVSQKMDDMASRVDDKIYDVSERLDKTHLEILSVNNSFEEFEKDADKKHEQLKGKLNQLFCNLSTVLVDVTELADRINDSSLSATILDSVQNLTDSLMNLDQQNKILTNHTQAMEQETKVIESELENSKSTAKLAFFVACSSFLVLGLILIAVVIFFRRTMSKVKKVEEVPLPTPTVVYSAKRNNVKILPDDGEPHLV